MIHHLFAFAVLLADAPRPPSSGRCLDATLTVGAHVPGGGYSGSVRANEVVGIDKAFWVDPAGHAVHLGYFYRTASRRVVFAGRTTPQVGVKNFDRVVKLYVDEGFPKDDAEMLVEQGPPILMWLPDSAAFLRKNHLKRAGCT